MSSGEKTSQLILWGKHGSGLTHCLQAVCHSGYKHSKNVAYMPLNELAGNEGNKLASFTATDICEGLEYADIVCLAGIDYICGMTQWEQAIFHLYNNLKDNHKTLIISSYTSPASIPIVLADLKSRLLGAELFRVQALNDSGKIQALVLRAKQKGLELGSDVAEYILLRAPRDTHSLFSLLDKLDDSQLQQHRKLTKPFVKQALEL